MWILKEISSAIGQFLKLNFFALNIKVQLEVIGL